MARSLPKAGWQRSGGFDRCISFCSPVMSPLLASVLPRPAISGFVLLCSGIFFLSYYFHFMSLFWENNVLDYFESGIQYKAHSPGHSYGGFQSALPLASLWGLGRVGTRPLRRQERAEGWQQLWGNSCHFHCSCHMGSVILPESGCLGTNSEGMSFIFSYLRKSLSQGYFENVHSIN